METKICSGKHGCGRELPVDQFTKSGLQRNLCKECDVKRSMKNYVYKNKERIDHYQLTSYYCNNCKRELPIENFYICSKPHTCKDGSVVHHTYVRRPCKLCTSEQYKQRYLEEGDRMREKQKEYRQVFLKTEEGLTLRRKTERRYRHKHPQKIKVKQRRIAQRAINELADWYVRLLWKQAGYNNPTPEMIHIKRLTVNIKRLLKQEKDEQLSESK